MNECHSFKETYIEYATILSHRVANGHMLNCRYIGLTLFSSLGMHKVAKSGRYENGLSFLYNAQGV